MARSSIDFVIMVDNAYYRRRSNSLQENAELAAKLLTDGHYGFSRWFDQIAYQNGDGNEGKMFYYIQSILIYAFFNDGVIRQSEYNAYCKFCSNTGHTPKSPSEMTTHYNKFPTSEFIKGFDVLAALRDKVDSTYYHSFLYGLVLLAVNSEGQFTERAYNLFTRLLTPGYDNCPSYYSLMQQVYP